MIQGKMTCFTTAVFLIRYFNAGASQQFLMDNLPMRPEVFVTYFVHDERKGGGDYVMFVLAFACEHNATGSADYPFTKPNEVCEDRFTQM